MALQHSNAPSRASSSGSGRTARSGVVHVNVRHTSRYTVVGNHLAQHRDLSLLAIGLAVHIQSLPDGAQIGIKFLAARFPESEYRIAAALRELEAHGYLRRTRERVQGGRVVTHTTSYNQPGGASSAPSSRTTPTPVRSTPPEPAVHAQAPTPPRASAPPLPAPATPDPDRHRAASDLLAGLHRTEPRLLLSEREVRRLAEATAAWLERGATPDAVRRTLTASLPDPLGHPAGLLAHRLTAMLPPPLPAAPRSPDPLQTCDDCDLAFRSPTPGRCRGCQDEALHAA
ncbi:hypothetical protein DSC45_00195 [Streptomyces sp. YIM 130001]|uniref:helix-turn-helix domain-containing protein n=1 Tax=Streptomyces sp. YIM 130001 TaxID=2259644 RepID=UPI000E655760|nr:helix-turn-helix domain-containing protein [Streptomyces sp. YIM 130001]RII22132.1 hypothetical protein DSC45_00195 [Streptomyces sp. YIM 130001]